MKLRAEFSELSADVHETWRVVREVRAELKNLREMFETYASRPAQPAERPDDLVGAEYVAKLFGCAVNTVRSGKANRKGARWVPRRPLRCTRAEAHAAVTRLDERAQEPMQRRVHSLVRRKPRD